MPVRVLEAKNLVLKHDENRRGDDHHGNGPAHDRSSLLSDVRISRKNVQRPSCQDETNDDRTDGGAAMVAEGSRGEEPGRTALPAQLADSHVPKDADHPESAAHQGYHGRTMAYVGFHGAAANHHTTLSTIRMHPINVSIWRVSPYFLRKRWASRCNVIRGIVSVSMTMPISAAERQVLASRITGKATTIT